MGEVAVEIDERLWKSFEGEILKKYGTTKRLNKEIEKLIASYLAKDAVIECLKYLSGTYGFIPLEDVKKERPELKSSAGRVLREMRDDRVGL
jgi:NADH:ubiquinone oxidoreductase subunit E